jgi:hypothetical protein
MDFRLTKINVKKLQMRLQRARIAALAAMEIGDCKAVARFTCEMARLRDAISLAGCMLLEPTRSHS